MAPFWCATTHGTASGAAAPRAATRSAAARPTSTAPSAPGCGTTTAGSNRGEAGSTEPAASGAAALRTRRLPAHDPGVAPPALEAHQAIWPGATLDRGAQARDAG